MVTITASADPFGHAQGHRHGAARGDAGEDALLARQAPGHLLGVGLADVLEAIDVALVVDLRQVFLGPLADAGNLRALLGLAADDLDLRILSLKKREQPMMVPVVPMLETKWVSLPSGVAPDLRPGALVVRQRIVGVGELVEHDALAFATMLVGDVARHLHAAPCGVTSTMSAPKARMVWRRSMERCSGMISTIL
jgi:hypothetical protein